MMSGPRHVPVEPRFGKLKLDQFVKIPKRERWDGELGSASHEIKQLQGLETSLGDRPALLTKRSKLTI